MDSKKPTIYGVSSFSMRKSRANDAAYAYLRTSTLNSKGSCLKSIDTFRTRPKSKEDTGSKFT